MKRDKKNSNFITIEAFFYENGLSIPVFGAGKPVKCLVILGTDTHTDSTMTCLLTQCFHNIAFFYENNKLTEVSTSLPSDS